MQIDRQLDEAEALIGAGRIDDAIALLVRVCSRKKQDGRALHMFGVARALRGENEEAEQLLRGARTLKPNSADILTDLGSVLILTGKNGEAVDVLQKARRRNPQSQLAMFHHGVALTKMKRLDEALAIFEALASRHPENISYEQNRASVLGKLARFEEAETAIDNVLRKQPSMTEALLVKALAALNRASYDEALAILDRIIAATPAHFEAILNRGQIRLLTGDMERGWPDYEARWARVAKPLVEGVAEWNGEPLGGRSLLVHCEQGLGDALQFCRYLKMLSAQGADVTLVAPQRMNAILASLSPGIRIVSKPPHQQAFDFQIPLVSLPMILGTRLESIPSSASYLSADPERVSLWKRKLGSAAGLKIGISWQGNPGGPDRRRAAPLHAFQPLSRHPAVRLISLQAIDGVEQLNSLPPGMAVETLDALDSGPDAFVDTAAVMENLDLVIAPDTAVAHLAGALGRPIWMVLQQVPDWRWLLGRADSPWYPTMKLYRQQRAGDWDPVFARMAADLDGLLT